MTRNDPRRRMPRGRRQRSEVLAWRRATVPIGVVAASLLAVGVCNAQSSDDAATARALFAEARKLSAQGQYDKACPKFEESNRLDPGIGTQFNLADCWEHQSRTASAWARFLDVASAARASNQSDREKVARERAAALEPKLSRLVIDVKAALPSLEVKRDGVNVGRASLGTAVPVDPGPHTIEATAPGKRPWSFRAIVPSTATATSVVVPMLEDDPYARAAAAQGAPALPAVGAPSDNRGATLAPAGGPNAGGPLTSPPADNGGSGNGQRVAGLVVGGLGIVGLAIGGVFYGEYSSNNSSAKGICAGQSLPCSTGAQGDKEVADHDAFASKAKDALTPMYVGLGVGGAALVTGAILFFTARSATPTAGTWTVAPVAQRDGWGAAVSGVF